MIARLSLVALSILVLSPPLLQAQTELQNPTATSAATASQHTVVAGRDAMKMYEDIEIFRRILDRKLNPLYPRITLERSGGMAGMQGGTGNFQGGMAGMLGGMENFQGGMAGGQPPGLTLSTYNPTWVHQETSRTLEGVYLEGQGIIYTATLATLQTRGKAEAPPAPPVDEWESLRRQLRNEKEQPKTEPSKPPDLSDVLLKTMADYGHHFSQLRDNESLNLILTVRDASPSAAKQKAELTPATEQKVRDLVRVADLHQKQGQYSEAITIYRKFLELNLVPKQEAAALHRKLAQCYLSLEQYDNARTELDAAQTLLKKGKDDKDKPASQPAPAALPVKLMISVPKRLLGEMVTGRISFDEFRRRASVRKLTFDERRP